MASAGRGYVRDERAEGAATATQVYEESPEPAPTSSKVSAEYGV